LRGSRRGSGVRTDHPAAFAPTATQQRVYGSGSVTASTSAVLGYNKDNTTGALTVLPGAPFADRLAGGLVAIDGLGKFLFVLNPDSNGICMYQIDSSNGALTEVPNSPFAVGPTVNALEETSRAHHVSRNSAIQDSWSALHHVFR